MLKVQGVIIQLYVQMSLYDDLHIRGLETDVGHAVTTLGLHKRPYNFVWRCKNPIRISIELLIVNEDD